MVACSCGKKFATFSPLFDHQRSTGHSFCGLCNRFFDTQHSLELHNQEGLHQSLSQSQNPEASPLKPSPAPAKNQTKKSWPCTKCDRSFSSTGAWENHCSVPHPHKCGSCSKAYITVRCLEHHKRFTGHCFCRECRRFFSNPQSLAQHLESEIHVGQYHCCDCDRDFVHQQALDQHLEFKDHSSIKKSLECNVCQRKFTTRAALDQHLHAKGHSLINNNHECTKCQREFPNQAALDKHLASVVHHPLSDLKCVASSDCNQRFSSPSALIHHLESGKCCSGLTRRSLNQLVQSNDTDRIISSGLQELDPLVGLHDRLSSLTITSHPIPTPDDSEDCTPIMTPATEDGSGVMLSPYLGRTYSTLSLSASPAFLDPPGQKSPPPAANGLFCPLCPARTKPFRTAAALHMHLDSPKHAPKVFHCPSNILPPTKNKRGHGASVKHFSTLSGLTQHIESGACRGGNATLWKAMEMVQKRLKDLGFEQVHLLK